MPSRLPLAAAARLCLLLAPLAAPLAAVPLPLGDVAAVAGPTACGDAQCYTLTVDCPDVEAPAMAKLEVGLPAATVPARGAVVFMTGGGGETFWEHFGADARRVLAELRAQGFTTVQLAWPDGWLVASPGEQAGQARLACRPATVFAWLHDRFTGPAFCATGNSGGSAQISYALARYGEAPLFAAVVPTGGPPMGRIDQGCIHTDPKQRRLWYDRWAAGLIDQGFGFAPGAGPCSHGDASFAAAFAAASVDTPDGDYVYPSTVEWFLYGAKDNTNAVPQGLLYVRTLRQAGGNEVHAQSVPNTPHPVPSTKQGANRIRDILLQSCVP